MSKKSKRPKVVAAETVCETPPRGQKIPTTNVKGCELVRITMRDSELARRLGLSRAAVGKWKVIPADRVNDVAKATGLKPEWIRPQPYA